jgi:hypothetical protein
MARFDGEGLYLPFVCPSVGGESILFLVVVCVKLIKCHVFN